MNLLKLYAQIDEREKGQNCEGESLNISADEIDELHKELSIISKSDIPKKYRTEIQNFLESSLLFLDQENTDLNTSLSSLVTDLRGY
ncbi:hypothetical protein [Desulfobacter sp.]|uniref:hypothetical protein n=1 Tax=Desulfobacter sp. TaxID=2294 RepID=UPI003D13375D